MAWTKMQTAAVTVAIIGLATYSVMEHRTQTQLRQQNETLLRQVDGLSQLKTENERLSNQLTLAKNSLTAERARLNNLLRQRAHVSAPRGVQATTTTPPLTPQQADTTVKLQVDSWNKAGLATPEDTLKTRGWAIVNGDRQEFAQSIYLTDGARKMIEDQVLQMAAASKDPDAPRIAQQALAENWGAEEAVLMPMMAANQNNPYTDYTILSQQSPSEDEVDMVVQTDSSSGAPTTETLKFQRFGDAWKIVIGDASVSH